MFASSEDSELSHLAIVCAIEKKIPTLRVLAHIFNKRCVGGRPNLNRINLIM